MDLDNLPIAREHLAPGGLLSRARSLALALRTARHHPGGLLIVGTPDDEPWHLAAHLSDQARLTGQPDLSPTLVRHRIPPGAPAHLAVDLSRLDLAGRGETVLVVAPGLAPAALLERINDARHGGATVFAIEAGDLELQQLAHETLTVPTIGLDLVETFDTTQHLVSIATGGTSAAANTGYLAPRRFAGTRRT